MKKHLGQLVFVMLVSIVASSSAIGSTSDSLTHMLIESGLESENNLHPVVQNLIEQQNYILESKFQVGTDLTGMALVNEREPAKSVVVYETSDGFLIYGEVHSPEGGALTAEHRQQHLPAVTKGKNDKGEAKRASGFAITEGTGEVVMDIFLDPQCSYCKKLWSDLRRELDVVTVNWRPVAIFPGSLSQVSALMLSKNPVAALRTLVVSGSIEQHPTTAEVVAGVRNNTQRMQKARMNQTPSGFIQLPNGQIQPFQGANIIQTIRNLRY